MGMEEAREKSEIARLEEGHISGEKGGGQHESDKECDEVRAGLF